MLTALNVVVHKLRILSEVPEIAHLIGQLEKTQDGMTEGIIRLFFKTVEGTESLPLLAEASNTLIAMGEERIGRLLDSICEYFGDLYEGQMSEDIKTNITLIKRTLAYFERDFEGVFPLHWHVSFKIALRLCQITRKSLEQSLAEGKTDFAEFGKFYKLEDLLEKRLNGGRGDVFKGIITLSITPHMDAYVASLDKTMEEMMETFIEDKSLVGETQVLASAPQLFVTLGNIPEHSIYKKYINRYASHLQQAFPSVEHPLTAGDISTVCIVISTAGFCVDSANRLQVEASFDRN
ncbi:vacuolar protein sorting-associated protein 53 B-like [Octopus sinensis]|uniref:Vacuolar protein sorting-associated protein 53 B-like n=1 Tax=Octopus sinensis TaxID=2607531 RepID=A0A6P7U8X4_9MOLL|nr:vacuolar protein sorting-associated protein 53 B-like [Octopus sinensis]